MMVKRTMHVLTMSVTFLFLHICEVVAQRVKGDSGSLLVGQISRLQKGPETRANTYLCIPVLSRHLGGVQLSVRCILGS
jgi:hypothetical protein